ncbi:MAG: hypothetical protein LC808_24070 [Actinobacteria bacterium]|nr:hypothetical protein [Actinomycetota bacterium]
MSVCAGLMVVAFLRPAAVVGEAQSTLSSQSPRETDRQVSGTGYWPLARLGYSVTVVDASQERGAISFVYQTPPEARQGPETWWHLRLHFRIRFLRQPSQAVYVSASTQGRTAAQVKFEPDASDASVVRWSSVTLTDRTDQSASWRDPIEVDTTNYLQYEGVSGGEIKLEVLLEQPTDRVVAELSVLDSTGISIDDNSPFDLALVARLPKGKVHEGDRFELPFTVVNSDSEPAGQVELRVRLLAEEGINFAGTPASSGPPTPEASQHQETVLPLGEIARSLSGTIPLVATRAGQYEIVMSVAGRAPNDRDAVRVQATVYGRGGSTVWVALMVFMLIGGGAALWRLARKR